MAYLRLTIGLLMLLVVIGCDTQQSTLSKHWFKGNLHTHSYWSDGDEFPEVIMDWYKSKGYHFVALSDHNTLAEGNKWKKISRDSIYQNAFKNYLSTYGTDWVNYKTDSLNQILVKLKTLEEYRVLFEEPETFLVIQSEEITDHFDNKPLHLNATNIQKKIEPQGGNSVVEVLQNNINAVLHQREETGIPMIPHVNHPNYGYTVSLDDMIALRNEQFFEVYNGHHLVHNAGDSTHISTEKMWDLINISHAKNNRPLMYGIATDDSHNYHIKGKTWSNAGRGWIMVRTDALDPKSLINAMERGQFYASTGVELNHLDFDGNSISVEVKNEPAITYTISFVGCRLGNTEPKELASIVGNQASFEVSQDLLFVRCKIMSSKLQENPIEDLIYEMAWTQPVRPTDQ